MDPYVLVLYYSQHHSILKMAQFIALGVEEANISARVRTVPKVSSVCEAIEEPIPQNGPPYVTQEDLQNCAGLILGSPAYFGNIAAPLKYFLDNTTPSWLAGDLVGKPAGVFTSSSTQHGGQETTLLTMMVPLLHHGMIIVGLPYTEAELIQTKNGGTPYGPTHVAGMNNQLPLTSDEIVLCKKFGKRIGGLSLTLLQN